MLFCSFSQSFFSQFQNIPKISAISIVSHEFKLDGVCICDPSPIWYVNSIHILLFWKIIHDKFWEYGRLYVRKQLVCMVDWVAETHCDHDNECSTLNLLSWIRCRSFEFGDFYQSKLSIKPFFKKFQPRFFLLLFLASENCGHVLHDVQDARQISELEWKNRYLGGSSDNSRKILIIFCTAFVVYSCTNVCVNLLIIKCHFNDRKYDGTSRGQSGCFMV